MTVQESRPALTVGFRHGTNIIVGCMRGALNAACSTHLDLVRENQDPGCLQCRSWASALRLLPALHCLS